MTKQTVYNMREETEMFLKGVDVKEIFFTMPEDRLELVPTEAERKAAWVKREGRSLDR